MAKDIKFTHEVEYSNYFQLGEAKILFDQVQEIATKSVSKKGDKVTYGFTTDNASFITKKDSLYLNGRLVEGFKFKGDYTYKAGELYNSKGTKMKLGKDFMKNSWGLAKRSEDAHGIKVMLTNYYYESGGGGYLKAKGFCCINESYIILKIWEHECYLWGVSYGKVKKEVVIDCLKRTVTIDSVEKKMVLPQL